MPSPDGNCIQSETDSPEGSSNRRRFTAVHGFLFDATWRGCIGNHRSASATQCPWAAGGRASCASSGRPQCSSIGGSPFRHSARKTDGRDYCGAAVSARRRAADLRLVAARRSVDRQSGAGERSRVGPVGRTSSPHEPPRGSVNSWRCGSRRRGIRAGDPGLLLLCWFSMEDGLVFDAISLSVVDRRMGMV